MSNYPSYQPAPQSLANLRMWKTGQSGNPGGNFNNTPKISNALARLMALDDAAFNSYVATNKADRLAHRLLKLADESNDLKELVAAFREIADRTEGKPLQTKVVEHTVSGETKQQVIELAYYQLFNDKSEEEALAAIREIYRQKAAGDQGAMMEAVKVAIAQDSEAISGYWSDAEKVVLGERVP